MSGDSHPHGGDASSVAARRDLAAIFAAAVAAVDPRALVRGYLTANPPSSGPLLAVGAGKAAAGMAAGVEDAVGARATGLVVTAPGCGVPLLSIRTAFGSHPLPDAASVSAAEALCRTLRDSGPDSAIVALISGGASSLLAAPRPPVTLADKLATNRLLLGCGAEIAELNAVRKHLSLVKGGGLLRLAGRRPVTTLILSDVPGDDPSVIGSAPTVPDPTTFADALAVLQRYHLLSRAPAAVRSLLEAGVQGQVEETVKPSSVTAPVVILGNNALARRAAAAEAAARGYEPIVDDDTLIGDTSAAARAWARRIGALPRKGRWCAIAGGETTVVVRGRGRGGRNQEFALVAAAELEGVQTSVLSAGTDGIDGPTDAAGAFADGSTLVRARRHGLDPERALADNDTYPFFDRLGDLFRTGPTGTNVMDLKIALGVGSAP